MDFNHFYKSIFTKMLNTKVWSIGIGRCTSGFKFNFMWCFFREECFFRMTMCSGVVTLTIV